MSPAELAALAAAVDLSDSDIEAAADRAVAQVLRLVRMWHDAGTPEALCLKALRDIARRHHVALPAKDSFTQRLNRMRDAAWWRRSLRRRFRIVERQAIQRGAVHAHASPYVSAKALRRFERDRRRLAQLLASMEALNVSTGEVMPLDEVIASSQANPANRRMAMMARIKGTEARALEKGDEARFLTITAPSRMHPRHATGQANQRHDGTGPREAHAYLHQLWRHAMRCLDREGLKPYGLRVVEPHHDGCPHWHVLMFAPAGQVDAIVATLRRYALADSPDEPGAAEHRFKVERIDPTKGSALAYVAKYVSKNIDGEGIDTDDEAAGTGVDRARRNVAWARLWGIRQFQFFGLPPITPRNELYRHNGEGLDNQPLGEAYVACKTNDYAAYLAALETHGISFTMRYRERASTRYPDETSRGVYGLSAHTIDSAEPLELVTRTDQWVIQPRKAAHQPADSASPWTRFNNCAAPCGSTTYAAPPRNPERTPPGVPLPQPRRTAGTPGAPVRAIERAEALPC